METLISEYVNSLDHGGWIYDKLSKLNMTFKELYYSIVNCFIRYEPIKGLYFGRILSHNSGKLYYKYTMDVVKEFSNYRVNVHVRGDSLTEILGVVVREKLCNEELEKVLSQIKGSELYNTIFAYFLSNDRGYVNSNDIAVTEYGVYMTCSRGIEMLCGGIDGPIYPSEFCIKISEILYTLPGYIIKIN